MHILQSIKARCLTAALVLFVMTAAPFAARAAQAAPTAPSAQADSTTLALGTVFGEIVRQNILPLEQRGLKIDRYAFARVFALAFTGEPTGMSIEEANNYMQRVMDALPHSAESADTVSVASQQEFINKAKAVDGAVVLPSTGTVFIVLQEGEGPMPVSGENVRVMYNGQLADGTVFDHTTEPIEFNVDNLVPGFTEGLKQMRPGGLYRMVIPASAAYGPKGIPGVIPGNAALDFTVELISIVK